jgi:hypothetical protein
VGDPIKLTVRVSGSGNVKLFPRPTVGVSWGSLVKGDERVHVDTNARRISGSKEFDWVLTPKIAGELDLPPIKYTYFNPESRRYEVASTNPARVHISPGSLASGDTAKMETLLSLRSRYRGTPSAPLHQRPIFWALIALAPLPALGLSERGRRRRRVPKPISRIARLSTLASEGDSSRDAGEIRRVYTGALAERLHLEPDSFTRPGALARAMRRRGVSPELALEAERFLRQLDEAAFAASGTLPSDAVKRAGTLYRRIDGDALSRTHIAARVVTIASLVLGFVATAHAVEVTGGRQAFDQGVAAYERQDYVAARESFIESVAAEPGAPDAWADLGTASWAVADTARSVAAWQRALRLEPLASDVRTRVELVHALPLSSAGYVPPLPSPWVFNLAAALWFAAWGLAAYRASRGQSVTNRPVLSMAVVAAVLAVGGFALNERLSGKHLAVIRHTASLSSDPQLGSERGATAIIGEVVRVTGRQGAWSRVRLDDGRDGWIENAGIVSLDTRDSEQIRAN